MNRRSIRRWWQIKTGRLDTPVDSEVPFWAVSLLFHLVLILILARVLITAPVDRHVQLEVDLPVEEILDEEVPPEIEFDEKMADEVGADSQHASEAADAQAPKFDLINEDTIDIEMPEHEVADLQTDDDFMEATAEVLSSLAVKGKTGQSVNGASGAVDRITQEILNSLSERKTLVIWLFDQSASLMRQRAEIRARFDNIYRELGMVEESGHQAFSNSGDDAALLTQVYGFGVQVTPMLRQPTADLEAIKEAVAKIKRDDTGVENVMTAIIEATSQYASLRKVKRSLGGPERNVMVIVVSDEAGDDTNRTDEAIRLCTRLQVPVYVIGVPAPFGRPETKVKWIDPDPQFDQSPQWAIVSQGPESAMAERLRLDFTGDFDDLDMIDSGFGPFHLTRMAYETGGIYFAVHPNRNTQREVGREETAEYAAHLHYFFDPAIMRRYKPDYVSNATYVKRLQANKARAALVQAAAFTTTGTLDTPQLRFPKLNEARFVEMVTRAQRTAAIVEPAVNRLYEILRQGEEDRAREISPRWKAGYDLAMGRAIAAKVRVTGYNAMLALAKTKLKFDPPKNGQPQNNVWTLQPADSIGTGSKDAKLLAKAKMYLNRVIEEHPGTPWAMLAQRELDTPIGWKWTQSYTAPPKPPPPRQPNPNNNNVRPNIPQPRENQMPKQLRPPPRL